MGSSGKFCQITGRRLALPGSSRPSNIQPTGDTIDYLLPLIFKHISSQGLRDVNICLESTLWNFFYLLGCFYSVKLCFFVYFFYNRDKQNMVLQILRELDFIIITIICSLAMQIWGNFSRLQKLGLRPLP